jgi:hypothetical protein
MLEIETGTVRGINFQRLQLEELSFRNRFHEIGQIKGIRLVKKMRRDGGDSFSFALGLVGRALAIKGMIVQGYPDVDDPRAGDYVLYYAGKPLASHIGILREDFKVVSRWGQGHVYEHPRLLLPASYGNKLRIVREPGAAR